MKLRRFLLGVLIASPVLGDVVTLNDGTALEGTIKRESGGWVVIDAKGKQTKLTDSQVQSIKKTSSLSPADQVASRLQSLKRATEGAGDIAQAIDKYSKFIEQNKGNTAVVEEAEKELAMWKERQAKGMVRVGTQWMTSEEHAALFEKSVGLIDQARSQLKDGRLKDAEGIITQLLSVDPENGSALYLRGVLAHKQGELGVAKRHFEKTREQVADHGPTLNNLAAILWQQKQYAAALPLYDQAMVASPINRQILDNVAEALAAMPKELRESQVTKRVAKRFVEQDTVLQQKLSEEGLFRWGSSYVNKNQKAEIDKAQARIDAKLKQVEEDYKKVEERIKAIDDQIDVNDRTMARINRDRTYTDSAGRIITLRPPSVYYELRRDNDKLKNERDTLAGKVDEFNQRARQIQQETPFPRFTGLHRLIESEGTPLVASRAEKKSDATTRPASRAVEKKA